jgi:hypothetical protein
MTAPDPGERDMFADLTRTLMEMKDAAHSAVQAAIEERFRRFVADSGTPAGASLQVTWTCSLPEGAASFAIYRTEYRMLAPSELAAGIAAVDSPRRSADIIAFPRR